MKIHPHAWLLWCLSIVVGASTTTSFWILCTLSISCCLIAYRFRCNLENRNAITIALTLGLFTLIVRLVVAIVFGVKIPGHVLLTLPEIVLPHWLAGISIGGAITLEKLQLIANSSFPLITLILGFGAFASLISPREFLKTLPKNFHNLGMVIVVAINFIPQLTENIQRVRLAQQLRGKSSKKLEMIRRSAIPVLEESLMGSSQLAATMESRGFGSGTSNSSKSKNLFLLLAMIGTGLSLYELLSPDGNLLIGGFSGLLSLLFILFGIWQGGRNIHVNQYRQIKWNTASKFIVLGAFFNAISFYLELNHLNQIGFTLISLVLIPYVANVRHD